MSKFDVKEKSTYQNLLWTSPHELISTHTLAYAETTGTDKKERIALVASAEHDRRPLKNVKICRIAWLFSPEFGNRPSCTHAMMKRIRSLKESERVVVDANSQVGDFTPGMSSLGDCIRGLRTLTSLEPIEVLRPVSVVAAIRIAIWFLLFRRFRRFINACELLPLALSVEIPVYHLVWAMRLVSGHISMVSCRTPSLALQFLLARTARMPLLHLGIKKDTQTCFQSRAWDEYTECPLLHTPSEVGTYSGLMAVEA